MIFGLFGGAKKQEKALRESLSLHEFEMEFPKMMERFKIQASTRAGKSAIYCEVEGAARYIVDQALRIAMKDGKVKTVEDLTAAATYCGLVVEFIGANAGLSGTEIRDLQGLVPGIVFPRVAATLFKPSDFKVIVSKGMLKVATMSRSKNRTVDVIFDAMTQFVTKRDAAYLATLSRTIDELR